MDLIFLFLLYILLIEVNKLSEADDNPLPKDETTPPVTNIYRAMEVCYTLYFLKLQSLNYLD